MKKILALLIVLLLVPLTTSAQDFCEGNFDYDDDVDGTDAFTFKTDFGRSLLKNPCPPDGPAPVSKTGKTLSVTTGDDGDLERGVPWPDPRFSDNGDGTVTDNLTGLVWLQDASCMGSWQWSGAVSSCNTLSHGDCSNTLLDNSSPGDWRLPNLRELQSLIDYGKFAPALPLEHPFLNVQNERYWSSTDVESDITSRWHVSIGSGSVAVTHTDLSNYVWPVRGGH